MPYPYSSDSYTPRGYVDPVQEPDNFPAQRGVMGNVSQSFITPAADRMQFAQEREASGEGLIGSVSKSTYGMDKDEYMLQTRFMADQVEQFDARMQMLSNVQQRMDPMANQRLQEATKKHEALQKAYTSGRINQLEMFRGAAQLNQQLSTFNWSTHIKGQGGAVGDYYEKEDGIMYYNKPGEGPVQVGYSEKYIKEHTSHNPVTGIVTIPTAPGKEPDRYNRKDLMDESEADMIDKFQDKIAKMSTELQAADPLERYSPQQHAERAQEIIVNSHEQAILAVKKLRGTEGTLTDSQQEKQVLQETGQATIPQNTIGVFAAEKVVKKNSDKQAAEADKVADKLIGDYGKMYNVPKGGAERAIQMGYTRDQIVRALGSLNQIKNQYPNANSISELPAEWQSIFTQSVQILRALKGK